MSFKDGPMFDIFIRQVTVCGRICYKSGVNMDQQTYRKSYKLP